MKEDEYVTMRQMEDLHWWYRGLRSMLSTFFPLGNNSADLVVLDCGCGTGANLRLVRQLAPRVTILGLDISTAALRWVGQHDGGLRCQADANHLPLASSSFDVVISCDLLGQRGIEWKTVAEQFFRVLKPSGTLLLNVPAFPWLRGEHDCATHVDRRFVPGELQAHLQAVGFREVKCRFWNGLLTFPLWAHRRSRRHIGDEEARSDLAVTNGILNELLSLWIRLETKLAAWVNLPVGSSIFVIARKND